MDSWTQFAPMVLVVIAFLIQQRLVVTPEQLEKKHREILEDAERKFVTLQAYNELKTQLNDFKSKIDKIYDCIIKQECEK